MYSSAFVSSLPVNRSPLRFFPHLSLLQKSNHELPAWRSFCHLLHESHKIILAEQYNSFSNRFPQRFIRLHQLLSAFSFGKTDCVDALRLCFLNSIYGFLYVDKLILLGANYQIYVVCLLGDMEDAAKQNSKINLM